MKKQLNNQTIAIAGCLVLAVIVLGAGYLAAVGPQSSKASSLSQQITTAQAQLAALRAGGTKTPDLRAAELYQLARAMPASDDMPGIVLELADLAGKSHVTLVSITPSPRIAQADGTSSIPIAVVVNGPFANLTAFLRAARAQVSVDSKLHVAGRLIVADQLQLTAATTSAAPGGTGGPTVAQNGSVQATMNLVAFDYGAPPSPSATAGVTGATSTTTTTSTTPASPSGSTAVGATPTGGSH